MTARREWKGLEQDVFQTLVLRVDFEAGDGAGPVEAFTIPVISRTGGVMLALVKGFVPSDLLEAGGFAGEADFVGPSHLLSVPAVLEEEDGAHVSLDFDVEVLLVDFHGSVAESLRGFDPVTEGPGIMCFCEENIDIYPEPNSLLTGALQWVEASGASDRVQFYSADEAHQPAMEGAPSSPVTTKQSKQKAATPAKRVTTAVLAEQLAGLASSLPALSTQLAQMEKRQEKVESLLAAPAQALVATLAVPAHRQPFVLAGKGGQTPNASRFLQHVGSPPRVKTPAQGAPAQTDASKFPEDVLVSQIASNDGFHILEEPRVRLLFHYEDPPRERS